MDKKKQEHTGNKPKQQSTMEKKKKKQHQQNENHKSKSIHDILPLELIHRILLRVPLRHLVRLKCVSKLWHSLISDPGFAESHVHLSAAPTHVCLLINDYSKACSVDIDTIFHGYKHATAVKEVSLPFKMKKHYDFEVMCSCRGFVLLHRAPHFFVVWNPVTGSSKIVSYSHIVSRSHRKWCLFPRSAILYGFGYDASQDDYLVVVASRDKNGQDHFDCLSLRTNSWINLNSALPKPLGVRNWESCGFFLNGAIHWSSCTLGVKDYSILIFDLKEKSFSTIFMPEQISRGECVPLCLSNGSDIVALDPAPISTYTDLSHGLSNSGTNYTVYTESLVSLPSDIKDKDRDKGQEEEKRPSESEGCQTGKEN
ncbi:hypothetical protein AHAS_Ahas04G0256500 [Arachis hypogaea]